MPLNVEDGFEASPKEPPDPLMTLQAPVPTEGVFAESVTVVNPHVKAPVLEKPAKAVVGFLLNAIDTSSVEAVQGLLLIVHLKV